MTSFEVLLMNQIRAADDELENPDWTVKDQGYQILTLSKALRTSISVYSIYSCSK